MSKQEIINITIEEIKDILNNVLGNKIYVKYSCDEPEIWKRIHSCIMEKYKVETFKLSPRTVCMIRAVMQEHILLYFNNMIYNEKVEKETTEYKNTILPAITAFNSRSYEEREAYIFGKKQELEIIKTEKKLKELKDEWSQKQVMMLEKVKKFNPPKKEAQENKESM